MAIEIERKFLVTSDAWRKDESGTPRVGIRFRQGYIPSEAATVRVRLEGSTGKLTVKARSQGIARLEYEYAIPTVDAMELLDNVCTQPQIDKIRYTVPFGPHMWEIDEFLGDNAGLVVAEIELGHEDEAFQRPDWLGDEVTHDTRYLNVNLAAHPYRRWV